MKKYLLPTVLFFQMVLLFTEVPNWVVLGCLFFAGLSLIPWIKLLPRLKWVTGFISVIMVLFVVRQFNLVLSNELIASLLIILTSIRLIEHRLESLEPPYFLFLLGLFLAVVKFVFQIDFVFGLYAFLATVFYLYQFFPVDFQKNYKKESYRILRTIIGNSIPVTILLFLVFPQFKFESKSQRNYGLFSTIGTSGFSAELRPGSISELVNNESIAFRAEFENFVPKREALYWRGQVLDRPQGLMWRRSNPLNKQVKAAEPEGTVYQPQYKIVLEPHFKEQLFTLYETSVVKSEENILRSDKNETYSLPNILIDRLVYDGAVQFNHRSILNGDRAEYVKLNRRAPKVEELIKILLDKKTDLKASAKVKVVAQYFAENHFEYRLSGQELAVNSIDEFLFKTKAGFCEHYASVAALMLRYMNVPSRVVVGYQGGELNSSGQFWTVRQQDAHAWVEYLNEDNQWIIFDPVEAIAPDRIIVGTAFLSPSSGQTQLFKKLTKAIPIVDQISGFMEIFNYRWTLFFVEYSSANLKREIFSFYQANEDVQIATQLIILLICIYIVFVFSQKYWLCKRSLKDRYSSELHGFFAKRLPQNKNETFVDWQKRLVEKYPASKQSIEAIFNLYLKNSYGPFADPEDFKFFKTLLSDKNFKAKI